MYVSIYTYNILICHTTRSQLPQTHKNNPFWCLGMFGFYELQGQRDDLQRGPDRQAAESSRQAPPVAVDAIVVVSTIFLLDFFGEVIFIMIYMMIIFQSPFFFLEVTFPFISRCFLSLFGKKNTAVASTKKDIVAKVQSSLRTRPEQLLEALEKVRLMVRVVRLGRVKTWVDSSCSLVNFDIFPTFVCSCGGGFGEKFLGFFFVGSIISEFENTKKPSPLNGGNLVAGIPGTL